MKETKTKLGTAMLGTGALLVLLAAGLMVACGKKESATKITPTEAVVVTNRPVATESTEPTQTEEAGITEEESEPAYFSVVEAEDGTKDVVLIAEETEVQTAEDGSTYVLVNDVPIMVTKDENGNLVVVDDAIKNAVLEAEPSEDSEPTEPVTETTEEPTKTESDDTTAGTTPTPTSTPKPIAIVIEKTDNGTVAVATPTPTVTGKVVANNTVAPTKTVTKATPTPTKAVAKKTATPTPTKAVAKKTATPTPTKAATKKATPTPTKAATKKATATPTPTPAGIDIWTMSEEEWDKARALVTNEMYDEALFNAINTYRVEHGYSKLVHNSYFQGAVDIRAEEQLQSYGHLRPTTDGTVKLSGTALPEYLRSIGITDEKVWEKMKSSGEIVAYAGFSWGYYDKVYGHTMEDFFGTEMEAYNTHRFSSYQEIAQFIADATAWYAVELWAGSEGHRNSMCSEKGVYMGAAMRYANANCTYAVAWIGWDLGENCSASWE